MRLLLALSVSLLISASAVAEAGTTPPLPSGSSLAGDVQKTRSALTLFAAGTKETDEQYQRVAFHEVPNLIENLELQKRFDEAEQLARTKYDTASRLFGKHSMTALDALQDLIFLKTQQHDDVQRKNFLGQYAALVSSMQSSGQDGLVEKANDIRTARLQRKLQEARSVLTFD
jgi:hypothetical protein